MLFGRRLGFSGTPSNLVPLELGQCQYEAGSDGQMLHVLTSPAVTSCRLLPDNWSVDVLLDAVAKSQPPFHALIDTGALITGLSNLEVARQLLARGLSHCDGVVFLDELDRKMILLRDSGHVIPLARCGIALNRRFAFYDQVHTTGMDIQHQLAAMAALTLGKDMSFRGAARLHPSIHHANSCNDCAYVYVCVCACLCADYAQGAFRMRGIGEGQTIQLLVTPEVAKLISTTKRQVADSGVKPRVTASQASYLNGCGLA